MDNQLLSLHRKAYFTYGLSNFELEISGVEYLDKCVTEASDDDLTARCRTIPSRIIDYINIYNDLAQELIELIRNQHSIVLGMATLPGNIRSYHDELSTIIQEIIRLSELLVNVADEIYILGNSKIIADEELLKRNSMIYTLFRQVIHSY
jgi:hypothetical protein